MDESKGLIKTRINYLVNQINNGNLNKKQVRKAKQELNGYGILLLHPKKKLVTLKVGEHLLKNFELAGKIESIQGTIIGFMCGNCFAITNVNQSDSLLHYCPDEKMPMCTVCGSYDVQPIHSNCIVVG